MIKPYFEGMQKHLTFYFYISKIKTLFINLERIY